MFSKMWRKSNNRANPSAYLLSEESISLEVSTFVENQHEESIEENIEEKTQLLPTPKIPPELWFKTLDFLNSTEATHLMLALGKAGKGLITDYVQSFDQFMQEASFPLYVDSFSKKLNQTVHIEKQKESKKRSISTIIISCLALTGIGIGSKLLSHADFLRKPADPLYDDIKIFYNNMEQTCSDIFSHYPRCTIIQDIPCYGGERCSTTYSCDTVHSYVLDCEDPPERVIPYSTSLFSRLSRCSPSLYGNYTAVCKEIQEIKRPATPYIWGGITLISLPLACCILVCCHLYVDQPKNDPILERQFSKLWNSFSEKDKNIFLQLIKFLKTDGLTISEVQKRISSIQTKPFLFFKKPEQTNEKMLLKKENNALYQVNVI